MAANLLSQPVATARRYASGSQTIPTGDVSTVVTLANVTDVRGPALIDTSVANTLKALVAGVYRVTYSLETAAGGTFRRVIVQVNGVLRLVNTVAASASVAPIVQSSAEIVLAAGDLVTLSGSSSGAAAAVGVADQYRTGLTLTYLGP